MPTALEMLCSPVFKVPLSGLVVNMKKLLWSTFAVVLLVFGAIQFVPSPALVIPAQLPLAERENHQIEDLGWKPRHDDGYQRGELGDAAAHYMAADVVDGLFPWPVEWDKREEYDPIRRRIVAMALGLAELERLTRERSIEWEE